MSRLKASVRAGLRDRILEKRQELLKLETELLLRCGWKFSHKYNGTTMYRHVLSPEPVFLGRERALLACMNPTKDAD